MTTPSTSSTRPPIRTLVVDDHPFFREGITSWIGRQDCLEYCGCADSPTTALSAIESTRPELVLLDLQLREGDGLDVLRALKTEGKSLHVIVVSNKDETIFAERVLRAGARGYVLKEEACDVMLAAIHTVFTGGIHVSPAMRQMLAGRETILGNDLPIDKLRGLYNRELQVLEKLGQGRSTKEIAFEMQISPKTVEAYRENLKKKLGITNGPQLIRFATVWQQDGGSRPAA